MSVAGISSTPVPTPDPASIAPALTVRRTEAHALRQALQSGDLAGAQSAFNILSGLGPNNSGPFKNPRLANDFAAVGTALQAGDLASAQSAFATLQQDIQTTIQNHQSHQVQNFADPEIIINVGNSAGATGNTSAASSNGANSNGSTGAASARPELVLNLGNPNVGAAGSEVTVNLGNANGGTGVHPSEIVLNLANTSGGNGTSPSEIVLNLGSAASNAQPIPGALEIKIVA